MSTSKKTTKTKSPAPATKTSATKTPATKTATASKTATRATTIQSSAPVTVAKPAATAAVAAPAAVRVVAPTPRVTTIAARVDVGFGNALFLRGEGAGLSWEKGVPMECLASDLWQIVLPESARSCTFKFLINDTTWCSGADYTAISGMSITLTPEF